MLDDSNSDISSEVMPEDMQRMIHNELQITAYEAHYDRQVIKTFAADLLKVLRGEVEGVEVHHHTSDDTKFYDSSPPGIPILTYSKSMRMRNQDDPPKYSTYIASIGAYAIKDYANRRPVELFDVGFYLGVLAAREGLVDVDVFEADPIYEHFEFKDFVYDPEPREVRRRKPKPQDETEIDTESGS